MTAFNRRESIYRTAISDLCFLSSLGIPYYTPFDEDTRFVDGITEKDDDRQDQDASQPLSFRAFVKRVESFDPLQWGASPVKAVMLAQHGWRLQEENILTCDSCKTSFDISKYSKHEIVPKLDLMDAHYRLCKWALASSPDEFVNIPESEIRLRHGVQLRTLRNYSLKSDLPVILPDIHKDLDVEDEFFEALCKEMGVPQTEEGIAALTLGLCGWVYSSDKPELNCRYCDREVKLDNFKTISNPLANYDNSVDSELEYLLSDASDSESVDSVQSIEEMDVIENENPREEEDNSVQSIEEMDVIENENPREEEDKSNKLTDNDIVQTECIEGHQGSREDDEGDEIPSHINEVDRISPVENSLQESDNDNKCSVNCSDNSEQDIKSKTDVSESVSSGSGKTEDQCSDHTVVDTSGSDGVSKSSKEANQVTLTPDDCNFQNSGNSISTERESVQGNSNVCTDTERSHNRPLQKLEDKVPDFCSSDSDNMDSDVVKAKQNVTYRNLHVANVENESLTMQGQLERPDVERDERLSSDSSRNVETIANSENESQAPSKETSSQLLDTPPLSELEDEESCKAGDRNENINMEEEAAFHTDNQSSDRNENNKMEEEEACHTDSQSNDCVVVDSSDSDDESRSPEKDDRVTQDSYSKFHNSSDHVLEQTESKTDVMEDAERILDNNLPRLESNECENIFSASTDSDDKTAEVVPEKHGVNSESETSEKKMITSELSQTSDEIKLNSINNSETGGQSPSKVVDCNQLPDTLHQSEEEDEESSEMGAEKENKNVPIGETKELHVENQSNECAAPNASEFDNESGSSKRCGDDIVDSTEFQISSDQISEQRGDVELKDSVIDEVGMQKLESNEPSNRFSTDLDNKIEELSTGKCIENSQSTDIEGKSESDASFQRQIDNIFGTKWIPSTDTDTNDTVLKTGDEGSAPSKGTECSQLPDTPHLSIGKCIENSQSTDIEGKSESDASFQRQIDNIFGTKWIPSTDTDTNDTVLKTGDEGSAPSKGTECSQLPDTPHLSTGKCIENSQSTDIEGKSESDASFQRQIDNIFGTKWIPSTDTDTNDTVLKIGDEGSAPSKGTECSQLPDTPHLSEVEDEKSSEDDNQQMSKEEAGTLQLLPRKRKRLDEQDSPHVSEVQNGEFSDEANKRALTNLDEADELHTNLKKPKLVSGLETLHHLEVEQESFVQPIESGNENIDTGDAEGQSSDCMVIDTLESNDEGNKQGVPQEADEEIVTDTFSVLKHLLQQVVYNEQSYAEEDTPHVNTGETEVDQVIPRDGEIQASTEVENMQCSSIHGESNGNVSNQVLGSEINLNESDIEIVSESLTNSHSVCNVKLDNSTSNHLEANKSNEPEDTEEEELSDQSSSAADVHGTSNEEVVNKSESDTYAVHMNGEGGSSNQAPDDSRENSSPNCNKEIADNLDDSSDCIIIDDDDDDDDNATHNYNNQKHPPKKHFTNLHMYSSQGRVYSDSEEYNDEDYSEEEDEDGYENDNSQGQMHHYEVYDDDSELEEGEIPNYRRIERYTDYNKVCNDRKGNGTNYSDLSEENEEYKDECIEETSAKYEMKPRAVVGKGKNIRLSDGELQEEEDDVSDDDYQSDEDDVLEEEQNCEKKPRAVVSKENNMRLTDEELQEEEDELQEDDEELQEDDEELHEDNEELQEDDEELEEDNEELQEEDEELQDEDEDVSDDDCDLSDDRELVEEEETYEEKQRAVVRKEKATELPDREFQDDDDPSGDDQSDEEDLLEEYQHYKKKQRAVASMGEDVRLPEDNSGDKESKEQPNEVEDVASGQVSSPSESQNASPTRKSRSSESENISPISKSESSESESISPTKSVSLEYVADSESSGPTEDRSRRKKRKHVDFVFSLPFSPEVRSRKRRKTSKIHGEVARYPHMFSDGSETRDVPDSPSCSDQEQSGKIHEQGERDKLTENKSEVRDGLGNSLCSDSEQSDRMVEQCADEPDKLMKNQSETNKGQMKSDKTKRVRKPKVLNPKEKAAYVVRKTKFDLLCHKLNFNPIKEHRFWCVWITGGLKYNLEQSASVRVNFENGLQWIVDKLKNNPEKSTPQSKVDGNDVTRMKSIMQSW